jgi:two-component sensor histidine kinase
MASLSDRIGLHIQLDEVVAEIDTAAPIGIILTELMTNSFKYAFPGDKRGTLSVSLEKTIAGARLTVADDGMGLPTGFDLSCCTGMGLNLVKALAEQVGGRFSIGPNPGPPGKGTIAIVDFKVGNIDRK